MKTHKRRLLDGEDFFSSDPELIRDKQKAFKFFSKFNNSFDELYNAEGELSKILGKVGKNIKVVPPLYFSYGYQIFLADNVHINVGVFLGDAGKIILEEGVLIGPYTQIYTTNHDLSPHKRGYITSKNVHIKKNAWIGGNVIILPGLTIGENAVIGAGSIVTKNVQANTVVAGNPAKVIKNLISQKE